MNPGFPPPQPASRDGVSAHQEVRFEVFRGGVTVSWEELFGAAAAFTGSLPPGSLINRSHSDNHKSGIVVVWYWSH